jgi:hypothetical protein
LIRVQKKYSILMQNNHQYLTLIFFLLSFIPSVIEAKEAEEKQQRWATFPVIASSPETGFILGGMLFHFLPVDKLDKQASTIDMIAFGTTKGQYLASLVSNIFSSDGLYFIKTGISFRSWKANYYSIGNDSPDISEDYESKTVEANVILQRRLFDSFTVDLIGNFQDINMEVETGGMLETHNIAGHEDGKYIDKDMLALQLEYRFPVKWKFSSAVFAEAAQVANDLRSKQRFNLRADLAWVDEGIGFIINVRSAF